MTTTANTIHYDIKDYSRCGISIRGIGQVGDLVTRDWSRVTCEDCKQGKFVGSLH